MLNARFRESPRIEAAASRRRKRAVASRGLAMKAGHALLVSAERARRLEGLIESAVFLLADEHVWTVRDVPDKQLLRMVGKVSHRLTQQEQECVRLRALLVTSTMEERDIEGMRAQRNEAQAEVARLKANDAEHVRVRGNLSAAVKDAERERDEVAHMCVKLSADVIKLKADLYKALGATCWICDKCGETRSGRGCKTCERDEARAAADKLAAALNESSAELTRVAEERNSFVAELARMRARERERHAN